LVADWLRNLGVGLRIGCGLVAQPRIGCAPEGVGRATFLKLTSRKLKYIYRYFFLHYVMYQITDYSYQQAKKLGVEIRPSSRKNKKIDVFKNNKLIASIGDDRYLDFPNYIKTKGLEYANQRRALYKLRHKNDLNKIGSNGFYANLLLW
jgi:hypothetical protein